MKDYCFSLFMIRVKVIRLMITASKPNSLVSIPSREVPLVKIANKATILVILMTNLRCLFDICFISFLSYMFVN